MHPYRLAYAQGGLYLLAYVPEYGEVRTFATERIQDISLLEERFTPDIEGTAGDGVSPFARRPFRPARARRDRLPTGGRRLRAGAAVAPVAARRGHPAGGVRVTLDVCIDRALHGWILSFGPFARVVSPESLAREIAKQIEEARAQYI